MVDLGRRPPQSGPARPDPDASSARPLPPLVVICGATATGKTNLSLRLATAIGDLEVVSADSRQVYRGMDIGTAKVTKNERAIVPHHCLDLVDPDEAFSVSLYLRHALEGLAGVAARGRAALLVGGTGLYLRAVARGVSLEHAPHDEGLRAILERDLAAQGLAALAARLTATAPMLAEHTDLANPRRVVRALERALLEGDRLPPPPRGYPGPVLWVGVHVDHVVHREWIARRAAGQFAGGLVTEAAALRQRFGADLPALSALGYREAIGVAEGTMSQTTALAETIVRTRAYARRQRTWFRAEPDIAWIDAGHDPFVQARTMVERFLASSVTGTARVHR
jgi:tRNA dimethylallyltransferase